MDPAAGVDCSAAAVHRGGATMPRLSRLTPRSPRPYSPAVLHSERPTAGARFALRERMSILAFILVGIVAGFLARAIMPGRQSMGFLPTAALGMVGSLVGGFLGNVISGEPLLDLDAAGLIGSVVGSLVVLALVGFSSRRRAVS
jgi:uncharacterized membrane protein YeaQ/YmgE (transglycosylase-associated protein family)